MFGLISEKRETGVKFTRVRSKTCICLACGSITHLQLEDPLLNDVFSIESFSDQFCFAVFLLYSIILEWRIFWHSRTLLSQVGRNFIREASLGLIEKALQACVWVFWMVDRVNRCSRVRWAGFGCSNSYFKRLISWLAVGGWYRLTLFQIKRWPGWFNCYSFKTPVINCFSLKTPGI